MKLGSCNASRTALSAFEPQRLIFNMLAGSVALNGIENIYCHNVALGNREGRIALPQYDYNLPLSFGSIEFGPMQKEKLSQTRKYNPNGVEYVPLTSVDGLAFEHVHLIKVDAEGMDAEIIDGAIATLERCRPVLFVEGIKVDRDALRAKLGILDYITMPRGNSDLFVPSEARDRFGDLSL